MKKAAKKAAPRKPRATKATSTQVLADALERIENTVLNNFSVLNTRTAQLERQITLIEKFCAPPVLEVPADALENKDRVQAGEVRIIPPAPVEQLVAALRGIEEAVVLIAERTQTLVELQLAKPPTKPRGKRAEAPPPVEGVTVKDNDVVDQGSPVVTEDPTGSSAPAEPEAKVVPVTPETGTDGMVVRKEDRVAVVEEKKAEPPPAPAAETKPANGAVVPFETIRARAVEFAQKHTKPKLIELVKKFVPAGTPDADAKLSVIPEDRRADFLKALEA